MARIHQKRSGPLFSVGHPAGYLRPAHSPEYKCCGPTVCNIDQFELRKQYLHCKMARKQRWTPILSKIDQELRESLRKKLSLQMDNTTLHVCKAEASKKEQMKMKFRKPHWPPIISVEENEKRRFRESLEEGGSQTTPSMSKQWPPKTKTVKVSN